MPGPPLSRGFYITHNDAPQSVGLLWTSDQLVAETCNSQHTTLTTDRHPCPRWDSNPQNERASGRRPTSSTTWPLGPAYLKGYAKKIGIIPLILKFITRRDGQRHALGHSTHRNSPGNHWIKGWVESRPGLEFLTREMNPGLSRPRSSQCTGYGILSSTPFLVYTWWEIVVQLERV
jgi:hypothetical protein